MKYFRFLLEASRLKCLLYSFCQLHYDPINYNFNNKINKTENKFTKTIEIHINSKINHQLPLVSQSFS